MPTKASVLAKRVRKPKDYVILLDDDLSEFPDLVKVRKTSTDLQELKAIARIGCSQMNLPRPPFNPRAVPGTRRTYRVTCRGSVSTNVPGGIYRI